MKVYTKVVIDTRTLEVIDEESFDYFGPVTECKGGGGGGGGSGKISYPAYMETMHGTWLTDVDGYIDTAITASPYTSALAYVPDTNLTAIDTAIAAFNSVADALDTSIETDYDLADTAIVAFDTEADALDTDISSNFGTVDTAITAFNVLIDALDMDVEYATTSSAVVSQVDDNVISTTHIDASIAAHAAAIDTDYDDMVAKLQSGMRDIGAAMTSSFVTAQTDLYAKKERDLTEFGKSLYVEAERQRNEMISRGIDKTIDSKVQRYGFEGDVVRLTSEVSAARTNATVQRAKLEGIVAQLTSTAKQGRHNSRMQRVQYEESVARLIADANRIRIISKTEEGKQNYDYDESDARWDLDMTEYGARMMASIGGGVATRGSTGMSKTQSALSGALTGAAIGANPALATATGGWSIAIGAGIGFMGGLL